HDILAKCIELGGSVTGEHGIGVEKIAFMDKLFSAADLDAMTSVREVFNPANRCNPSKMLPTGGHCVEVGLPTVRRAM
ncbi:MAG: FAD-linked oxidase C-terminal domain-containing protein, partial [Planctomycetia bacterium]